MEMDMVADMGVDMVADMDVDMVADMEVNMEEDTMLTKFHNFDQKLAWLPSFASLFLNF